MKIKSVKSIMDDKKLDLCIFFNLDSTKTDSNMIYFSGYSGIGALIVPRKKPAFLIVPEMEYLRAKKSMIKRAYKLDKKRFFESVKDIIKKNKIKYNKIGIDGDGFTLNQYKHFKKNFKGLKTKDIFLDCMRLRQTKTKDEISIMKQGFNIANKIFLKAIKNFKKFKTESDASSFLEYETKKRGYDVSFSPIVASGSNGAESHHEPSDIKLKRGFCVIDFGIKYKGYCTDMTRTIYLGKPSIKERKAYDMLLRVQNSIIKNIKLNDNCGKIYDDCVKNLGKYSKYFTHGLGHGVGVALHELPNLTLNSKEKIVNNMIFTIEPGIYIPNKYGIRIEDTVVMKNKPEILTKVSKKLMMI